VTENERRDEAETAAEDVPKQRDEQALSRAWRLRVGRVGKVLGKRALPIAGKIALQLIAALLGDEIRSLLGK
jgi:hypothetical protein